MPLFPQIDPFAPPQAPSPYGQMPDLSGLQALMSSFGDTAQGLVDRNLGNPTQPGASGDYLNALLSGGTQAQNDRFSAMYAPGRYHDEVAAGLANDPVFGKQFAPQTDPTVTFFGNNQAASPPAPAITDDLLSQMRNQGQLDGVSGVSLSPQQTSVALQNRLDDRADREAFNARKFSISPFAGADPTKVMAMMYEAALAEQQMQAQARQMEEKNRLAQWMGESENDYRNQQLAMQGRGLDAEIAQAQAAQDRLASQDAWQRAQFGMTHSLDQQRLAQEGQLGWKDLVGILLGEAGQAQGGPGATMKILRDAGVPLPGGATFPATAATGETPAVSPLLGLTGALKDQIATLTPDAQVDAMRLAGKSDDEITAILQALDPNGINVSADMPGGASPLWQGMKMIPFSPAWIDSAFLRGAGERLMGGDPQASWNAVWDKVN